MQTFLHGNTVRTPLSHNPHVARNSATLPMTARPGVVQRASSARAGSAGEAGLRHTLRQFFASGRRRAALDTRQAEKRLTASMKDFIFVWSRRHIDDLSPRDGAKLLKIACADTLPLGVRVDGHGHGNEDSQTRPRSDTEESLRDSVILPAEPALRASVHTCLSAMEDQGRLSVLYNDLATPPRAARDLVGHLASKLRPVAVGILDLLEQAVARELAIRVGTPLLRQLLEAAARCPPAPEAVRDALEQLKGIGQWLSSAERTGAQVLNLILDTLSETELGVLVAQAWPELSALDQLYGADPVAMAAAVAFINDCDADTLAIWRDALAIRLRRHKRLVATRVAERVTGADSRDRITNAIRTTYAVLDGTAHTLAGHLPNVSVLRARIRDEALALVLHRLPPPLRDASLRALHARDLSSLKSSLNASADMPKVRTTISVAVDSVQDDMLAADRQAVEDALAALHEALDREDRAAATARLGALSRAVEELTLTQAAFHTDMPASLAQSLEHVVACVRGLLLGEEGGGDTRVVRGLSDIELGQLRAAVRPMAPFGALIDKDVLNLEVRARLGMPFSARELMDRVIDISMDERADPFDIFARLRDLTDVLVRYNRRRVELGEENSADANEALVYDLVQEALDRLARADGNEVARLRQVQPGHCGITGDTLCEPLYALAEFTARQRAEDTNQLNHLIAMLTLARRVHRFLYAATAKLGAGDAPGPTAPTAHVNSANPNDYDSEALRAAIAGEFGVEWDALGQTAGPVVTPRHQALFKRHLAAPLAVGASPSRSVRLPVADGEESWFSVSDTFARDMLRQSGMSLAVEGINARGHPVRYAGFDPALDKQERRAAMGAAMHALRALAEDAAHALTRVIHRGVPDAFFAALAASAEDSPLRLRDGTRVLLAAACDTTHFLVRRRSNGHYHIETIITWSAIDSAIPAQRQRGGSGVIALDPARSRVQAAFTLATDTNGAVTGLWEEVDIRYRLFVRDDTSVGRPV